MMKDLPDKYNNFILNTDANGNLKVELFLQNETLWLTRKALAKLFVVSVPAIAKHLKNIFMNGELMENEVVSILEITTRHRAIQGKTQTNKVKFYNLDAIIAVGYRVNSKQATLSEVEVW